MEALGLRRSEKREFKVKPQIRNLRTDAFGPIHFSINSNWHSGDGPWLDFDDSIRGYGIPFTKFTPGYQDIDWDDEAFCLTVADQAYEFTLTFKD